MGCAQKRCARRLTSTWRRRAPCRSAAHGASLQHGGGGPRAGALGTAPHFKMAAGHVQERWAQRLSSRWRRRAVRRSATPHTVISSTGSSIAAPDQQELCPLPADKNPIKWGRGGGFVLFCWPLRKVCGILVPHEGLNPGPLQWKHRVLIPGPPGSSLGGVDSRE